MQHPRLHIHLSALNLLVVGALIVLTFKCVTALLNPVSRKVDGIKWGLVSYTVVMFSVVTVATVVTCDYISLGFIDNRASPGGRPLTYLMFMAPKALGFIPTLMGLLNYWLADALLVSISFDLRLLAEVSNDNSFSSTVVT